MASDAKLFHTATTLPRGLKEESLKQLKEEEEEEYKFELKLTEPINKSADPAKLLCPLCNPLDESDDCVDVCDYRSFSTCIV